MSRKMMLLGGMLGALLALPSTAGAHAGHEHSVAGAVTHTDVFTGPAVKRTVRRTRKLAVAAQVEQAALPSQWCGQPVDVDLPGDAQPAMKLVYAYAADRPNQFARYADIMQRNARWAMEAVSVASDGRRTVRFDMGSSCGGDYADIAIVALPHPAAYYTETYENRFHRVATDVRAALGASATLNYAVYADGLTRPNETAAGQGEVLVDDRAGLDNQHTQGGRVAILWGDGSEQFLGTEESAAFTLLHETFHNLGAVQNSAPNASGAFHCNDGYELMCYADGGEKSKFTETCAYQSGLPLIDCNGDDYFNPAPAPGSYLATHWNTYNSPFLCELALCLPRSAHLSQRLSLDRTPVRQRISGRARQRVTVRGAATQSGKVYVRLYTGRLAGRKLHAAGARIYDRVRLAKKIVTVPRAGGFSMRVPVRVSRKQLRKRGMRVLVRLSTYSRAGEIEITYARVQVR